MLLSSVVLPLYIYPSGDQPLSGTWAPLFNAISANPSVNFTVIVNPADGPGWTPYPNANYTAHVAQLNSYPSVTTLGYVHTSYTNRQIMAVRTDINTYSNWAKYQGADIHVDGIFLDEAPSKATVATLSYMQNAASAVRSSFPPGRSTVMTNPGVQVDARFYASADFIIVFENTSSAYSPDVMASTPAGFKSQSTFLIHSFTGDAAEQQRIVDSTKQGGFGGLLVTTANDYNVFSGLWSQLCSQDGSAA